MTTTTKQLTGSVAEWSDLDFELKVLDEAIATPAQPLLDVGGPRASGVYFTMYRGQLKLYEPIADGSWPLYVGTAQDLHERFGRHKINCRPIRNLNGGADLAVIAVETESDAAARYGEALCIARLQPLLNQSFMAGFGSKMQGGTRQGQSPPPFALLHPGRVVGTGPSSVSTALLRRRAADHLAATAIPLWPTSR